jgi:hypothetical protein
MITELVLLLGFLGFLAVRTDFIRRRAAFVASLVCWGLARFLTEYTFKVGDGGSLDYQYASLTSYAAALCICLCVLFMFVACLGARRRTDYGSGLAVTDGGPDEDDGPSPSPSERIREIVSHK